MRKGSRGKWAALVVIALAVVGFAIGGVVGITAPSHSNASAPTSSPITGAVPSASGPLTALSDSTSGLSPTSPTVMGQYIVVPHAEVPAGDSPLPANVTATVALQPSHDLQGFLNALNNPNNPQYRKFLTLDAVGSSFGSTSYAAAVNYFESYGLTVQLSAGLLTLAVSGTPSQMGAAFHTSFAAFADTYHSQGLWNPLYGNESEVANTTEYGAGFYANTEPLALPASLEGVVAGVSGLAGMTAQPMIAAPLGYGPGATNSSADPSMGQIQGLAGGNFSWQMGAPDSFECQFYGIGCSAAQTLYPSTMHALSGAGNLWTGATTLKNEPDLGQGVTIALIEVGCLDTATINDFSSQVWTNSSQPGLPMSARVTQFAINTGVGLLPNDNLEFCVEQGMLSGWLVETALDAEYAATMAPLAHIDIIGIPSPGYFGDFDTAYSLIAQDLSSTSTGGTCPTSILPATNSWTAPPGLYLVDGSSAGACTVTITSNSYGEGEAYTVIFGSPMYLTVEDTLLEELNAVGVTNFFASGDNAGATSSAANQAGMPAASPGATSVGGGQTTAEYDGQAFPVTSTFMCASGYVYVGEGWCAVTWYYGLTASDCANFGVEYGFCEAAEYVAPASGLDSYTYWAYDQGSLGTQQGIVGGAFGQSIMETQPWWQNGLDTYSTGAAIDPVISFEAAFNMSVFESFDGGWLTNYGGTSFATPTVAGEWALIEEQANVAFGNPAMGDINPLLYAAHNAHEAGVSSFVTNPYVDMTDIGVGFDWGPINSYNWYFYNLSVNVPYDPVLPWWFNTLSNPAGSGWNYLQGLGMMQMGVLDQELFGEITGPGHALTNPAYQVEMVTPGGTLVPLEGETLVAGTTYTLEIIDLQGQTGVYNVQAYSGQSSDGSYGGGTVTSVQTGSNGQFTYTPMSGTPPGGADATTYGYFLVTSLVGAVPDWSFADFAVAAPAVSGNLSLCVLDPQGVCDTGIAEVTSFSTGMTGYYNLYPQAFVTLNGVPVADAVVTEVAVDVSLYHAMDPTMSLSSFAPGATLGQFITGSSGDTNFWTDAFTAEFNGHLPTQVVQLTASYGGVVSNSVTVFIEPQSGSFDSQAIGLNANGSAVVGTLTFSDMKYVNFVNVSIGSAPGQYVNTSYPPQFYDSYAHFWISGVSSGQIPVNLSTTGLTGPIEVSLVASGSDDVSVISCEGAFGCFNTRDVQNPITWADPLVFLPAALSATATGTVQGVDTISWSGTGYAGAVGTLSLVWAGGSEVLGTYALSPQDATTGSFALNTSALLDGSYLVVLTETAPGVATTTRTVALYADNQAATASALASELQSELTSAQATIASLNAQVASLQSSLAAANATIASLQSQISSLQGQVSTLDGQLATAQAQVQTLTGEVQALTADDAANASEVASLQAELATAQSQVTTDLTQISSLHSEVQTLQNELTAKRGYVAPAWYDTFPGGAIGMVALFAALGAIVAGFGAYFVGRRTGRRSRVPSVPTDGRPVPPAETNPGVPTPEPTSDLGSEDVLRRTGPSAPIAPYVLNEPTLDGDPFDTAQVPRVATGRPREREGPESLYR